MTGECTLKWRCFLVSDGIRTADGRRGHCDTEGTDE